MRSFNIRLLLSSLFLITALSGFAQNWDSTVIKRPLQTGTIQVDGESVNYGLETPRQAVLTHLMFLQAATYDAEKAILPFPVEDSEEALDLADELLQIWDGEGRYIDIDLIPNDPEYVDSATKLQRFTIYPDQPRIYLEKRGKNWYYSRRTLAEIPTIHAEVFPFGSDLLKKITPQEFWDKEYLGLELRQYAGIVLLAIITYLLHLVLTFLIRIVIRKVAERISHVSAELSYFQRIAGAISLFVMVIVVLQLLPILQLPISFGVYIVAISKILSVIFAALTFTRILDLVTVYLKRFADKTEGTLDDQLVPLASKAMKGVVWILAFLVALSLLGVNITALLAGLSIGGLALALAAQDTLKNLFGSIMIFVDRPFQIGEWINFNGTDGTVEEVGLRSTRIRTFYNSLVYIPNGMIADDMVDNYGLRTYRRFRTTLGLTYDTPTSLILSYVEGLKEIFNSHPAIVKESITVAFNNMGAHSLDILINTHLNVGSYADEVKAKEELFIAIMELAEIMGINFAFPTQTLQMETLPGQQSLSPDYEADPQKVQEKRNSFIGLIGKRFGGKENKE